MVLWFCSAIVGSGLGSHGCCLLWVSFYYVNPGWRFLAPRLGSRLFHNLRTLHLLQEICLLDCQWPLESGGNSVQLHEPTMQCRLMGFHWTCRYPLCVFSQASHASSDSQSPSMSHTPHTVNSLWPSDAIWQQRSGSILAQVMACCLTAPSHYLNQCWLIISEVQWH